MVRTERAVGDQGACIVIKRRQTSARMEGRPCPRNGLPRSGLRGEVASPSPFDESIAAFDCFCLANRIASFRICSVPGGVSAKILERGTPPGPRTLHWRPRICSSSASCRSFSVAARTADQGACIVIKRRQTSARMEGRPCPRNGLPRSGLRGEVASPSPFDESIAAFDCFCLANRIASFRICSVPGGVSAKILERGTPPGPRTLHWRPRTCSSPASCRSFSVAARTADPANASLRSSALSLSFSSSSPAAVKSSKSLNRQPGNGSTSSPATGFS